MVNIYFALQIENIYDVFKAKLEVEQNQKKFYDIDQQNWSENLS